MTGLTRLSSHASGPPPGVPQIVAAVEDEIVSGTWPPGFRLPSERKLADQVAVSRPVIREALRVLAERGLIEVSAGRGSFVREINASGESSNVDLLTRRGQIRARDLVAARTMLEAETAELAAIHRTDEQLEQMRELLAAFGHGNIQQTANLDLAFHESIAIASHNPVLQVMFGSIRNLTHGIMLRSLTDREVAGAAVPLHNVIFEAIRDQDPVRARAAMTDHIGTAKKFYGADMDLPLAEMLLARAEATPSLASVMRELSRTIAESGEEDATA